MDVRRYNVVELGPFSYLALFLIGLASLLPCILLSWLDRLGNMKKLLLWLWPAASVLLAAYWCSEVTRASAQAIILGFRRGAPRNPFKITKLD